MKNNQSTSVQSANASENRNSRLEPALVRRTLAMALIFGIGLTACTNGNLSSPSQEGEDQKSFAQASECGEDCESNEVGVDDGQTMSPQSSKRESVYKAVAHIGRNNDTTGEWETIFGQKFIGFDESRTDAQQDALDACKLHLIQYQFDEVFKNAECKISRTKVSHGRRVYKCVVHIAEPLGGEDYEKIPGQKFISIDGSKAEACREAIEDCEIQLAHYNAQTPPVFLGDSCVITKQRRVKTR